MELVDQLNNIIVCTRKACEATHLSLCHSIIRKDVMPKLRALINELLLTNRAKLNEFQQDDDIEYFDFNPTEPEQDNFGWGD